MDIDLSGYTREELEKMIEVLQKRLKDYEARDDLEREVGIKAVLKALERTERAIERRRI